MTSKTVLKREAEKFLNEEILGNPPLSSKEMRDLDAMLTKILRESNQQTRDELLAFLKGWEIRTLFLNALQEAKDMQDGTENKNRGKHNRTNKQ